MLRTNFYVCLATVLMAGQSTLVLAQSGVISESDPSIERYATRVVDYSPAAGLGSAVSDPSAALGAPDSGSTGSPNFEPVGLVSLGDAADGMPAGSITLGFDAPIADAFGSEFAIFENASSFSGASVFAELAFFEVSSDGSAFARFDTLSLSTDPTLPGATAMPDTDLLVNFGRNFASIANRDLVSGFAGVDPARSGTLFDLQALEANPLVVGGAVDLGNINFVRLVDVPGDGRFLDSRGNPIFDSFDAGNGSGGFDLDAIGVVSSVPEPSGILVLAGLGIVGGFKRRRVAKKIHVMSDGSNA